VALFDKDYDDLGIEVLRKSNYPELKEGETISRNLVLYNDCFSERNIQVEIRLESNGKLLANDIRNFEVPLGEHRDFKCEITVPSSENGILNLVLITRKTGKLTFIETRKFKVVNNTINSKPGIPSLKIII